MLKALALLLPALIPSWRFFKAVAPSPRVEVFKGGEWVECDPKPETVIFTKQVKNLFWNPDGNASLFIVSLSERHCTEPSEFTSKELRRRIEAVVGDTVERYRLTFVSREGDEIVRTVEFDSADEVLHDAH